RCPARQGKAEGQGTAQGQGTLQGEGNSQGEGTREGGEADGQEASSRLEGGEAAGQDGPSRLAAAAPVTSQPPRVARQDFPKPSGWNPPLPLPRSLCAPTASRRGVRCQVPLERVSRRSYYADRWDWPDTISTTRAGDGMPAWP